MSPYRDRVSSSAIEEDLWLRLDWALSEALLFPYWARHLAGQVLQMSADFPDVRLAAERLLEVLHI